MLKLKNVFRVIVVIFMICLSFSLIVSCKNKDKVDDEKPKTIYELYKEAYPDYSGTEEEWLKSLLDGTLNKPEEVDSIEIVYELYKEAHPDYEGTKDDWLEEILGYSIGEDETCEVIFKLDENDQEPYARITVQKGETIEFPKDKPSKRGYNFVCWGYDNCEWPISYPITHDTVITAMWEVGQYNIIYNMDNGENSTNNPNVYTILDEIILENPKKDHYDFEGWYTDKDFTDESKIQKIEKGNASHIELWAKWTPTEYMISYEDIDDAVFDGEKPLSYNYETDGLHLPSLSKEHYAFEGWTGGDVTSPSKNIFINYGTSGNLTYTAHWTPIVYTISYELNGGTNNSSNRKEYTIESFKDGGKIVLYNPTKEQVKNVKNSILIGQTGNYDQEYTISTFEFNGWYLDYDVDKKNKITEINLSDGNVKVVADWIETEGEVENEICAYNREGDIIYMGLYPQSKVENETVLNSLEKYEFDIRTLWEIDSPYYKKEWWTPEVPEGWVNADSYWYQDVVVDGVKYRGIFIVKSKKGYAQENAGYVPMIAETGYRNKTRLDEIKVHWFRYDPIKWHILEVSNGEALLFADTKFEIMAYGHNDWQVCTIRSYFNSTDEYTDNGLYDMIFDELQKGIVQDSVNRNDAKSMGLLVTDFATPETTDKLFLLSYEEADKYKVYQSIYCPKDSEYCTALLSGGAYWTRSHCPYNNNSNSMIAVFSYGNLSNHPGREYTDLVVSPAPAVRIKL